MTDPVPCLTLLVPGPFASAAELARSLQATGLVHPIRIDEGELAAGEVGLRLVEDPELVHAFRNGVECDEGVLERVTAAGRAAVVDIALRLLDDHASIASVVRALEKAGGIAVRMEGSGGAWAFGPWFDCVESGELAALHEVAVVFVRDGDTVFTCGMHQLGLPDAEIQLADPRAAAGWLGTFQLFQLFERPELASGHTFQPDPESKRRILERWPDGRHRVGDGRHNPFGLVRFLPEDAPERDVPDPVPVIMPSLVAILMAAERDAGRALEQSEVEAIVERSSAVALPLSAVLELERRRGYADIDPEHAWAQWSIVRAMQ